MCVYIDWFNWLKVSDFWSTVLLEYIRVVQFDGLWTTMNEPYSVQQGEIDPNFQKPDPIKTTILKAEN